MSKIEWTDETWNPIVGCSLVSPGCTNCYAMKQAARIELMTKGENASRDFDRRTRGEGLRPIVSAYAGTTKPSRGGPVWTGHVARASDATLTLPLRWKRPRRIFVNSMGDLFHESVPDEWIDKVFAVMALAPQHTFQVLTKRSKRMLEYMTAPLTGPWAGRVVRVGWDDDVPRPETAVGWRMREAVRNMLLTAPGESLNRAIDFMDRRDGGEGDGFFRRWPLPNVWLGVSAEDQTRYDERVPDLLATPAAVHFFSFEPLLGPIRADYLGEWSIVGGESGPGARPMNVEWARSIVDQCRSAGVSCFVKQLGADPVWADGAFLNLRDRKGGDMAEWPTDLRVREMPGPRA